MVKVLVYGLNESFGGIERIMFDLFSRASNNFVIDFTFSCQKPDYFVEFEKKGFRYRKIPKLSEGYKYYSGIVKLCEEENYDIAYCNLSFSNILLYFALKSGNIHKIIFHSHSTMIDSNNEIKRLALKLFHFISKPICSHYVDGKFACSESAYTWLFGEDKHKHEIIHNAVKIDEFIHDKNIDERYKLELFGEKDIKVIGHVGRFSYQKNHKYLLQIFKSIEELDSKYRLLLIGDGELLDEIRQYSVELGINKKIVFTGFVNDVKKYYQAMDCFVLPSRFEGLCVVGVEAQASGLPCFLSDTITREISLTSNTIFLSIKINPDVWAQEIHNCLVKCIRSDMTERIREAGYDIDYEAERFINKLNNFVDEL